MSSFPRDHHAPSPRSLMGLPLLFSLLGVGACLEEPLNALGGRVDGLICSEDSGFPLAHADLTLGGQQGRSDRDGEFSFEQVGTGPNELVVDTSRRDRTFSLDVLAFGETTFFVDEACRGLPGGPGTGGIRGQVCNRHVGEVLRDALVEVIVASEVILATHTDDEGLFALDAVPAGDVLLKISAPGYSRILALEITDGEVTDVDLGECLRPDLSQGFLTGSLCDALHGGPLVGALVAAADADGANVSDVTDVDGHFLVGPLASGLALVHISAPGVDLNYEATVLGGQDVVVVEPRECPDEPDEPDEPLPPGTAAVQGRVCAPGVDDTWLAGAVVTVELPGGQTFTTTTDGEGRWSLFGLPPGEHVVHIQAGSFSDAVTVVLQDGETLLLPDEQCAIDTSGVRIAVVAGDYDDVGSVLDNVGIDPGMITDYDRYGWTDGFLTDYESLAVYDIVFVNCGFDETAYLDTPVMQANLRQYVQNGGSLYASDQAYDLIELAFPSYVDFVGDDTVPNSAEIGVEGVYFGAVIDPQLAGAVGTTSIDLNYPLPQWALVQSVSPSVRLFITGEADSSDDLFSGETHYVDIPHTLSFEVGEGKVVFSSFHQEPGVNIKQEQVLRLLMFQL